MRVLTICVPQAGHLNPLLPLIRQFLDDGDEVVVAAAADVREPVLAAGADFRQAGHGLSTYFTEMAARTRGQPGDGLPPERIPYYFTPRLFAEIAVVDVIDDAVSIAREFRPDAVLFDTEAFAGPLVAALTGARPIHHTIGPPLPLDVLDLCSDSLSPIWRSFGRERPSSGGLFDGMTVSISPASFGGPPLPGTVASLRPTPLPLRPPAPQRPPLIYVTFGTLWADAEVLRAVLAGLAELDVEVLVTLGRLDADELGEIPGNVTVEAFVPQAEVLPRCSAVIDHAGAGTMLGALAHGLPQLLLPQAADNFSNAQALVDAGAAIQLLPGQVTAGEVRRTIERLVSDARLRDRSSVLAREIAGMPGPETVAASLREWVSTSP